MGNATPSNQYSELRTKAVQRTLAPFLLLSLLMAACDGGLRGEVGVYTGEGGSLDGSSGPVGDGDLGPDRADGSSEGECGASADVVALRKRTTVWILADASGAMRDTDDQTLGVGVTGWEALKRILIGESGLIPAFDGAVEFGVVFHARDAMCPALVSLKPAPSNSGPIASIYPAEPIQQGGGPLTYRALELVRQHIEDTESGARPSTEHIVIIARTPFFEQACAEELPPGGGFNVVNEMVKESLTRLVAKGATAFVVRIPLRTLVSEEFEHELARIGGTNRAYAPMDATVLRQDFASILRNSVSCEVTLNGKVSEGAECQGTLEVDGVAIPCNASDGFRLKDAQTLELIGSACDDLRDRPTAQIRANFPCGAIIF